DDCGRTPVDLASCYDLLDYARRRPPRCPRRGTARILAHAAARPHPRYAIARGPPFDSFPSRRPRGPLLFSEEPAGSGPHHTGRGASAGRVQQAGRRTGGLISWATSSPATTNAAGARRSTRAGWRTRPPARRPPDGSLRRGKRRRGVGCAEEGWREGRWALSRY